MRTDLARSAASDHRGAGIMAQFEAFYRTAKNPASRKIYLPVNQRPIKQLPAGNYRPSIEWPRTRDVPVSTRLDLAAVQLGLALAHVGRPLFLPERRQARGADDLFEARMLAEKAGLRHPQHAQWQALALPLQA